MTFSRRPSASTVRLLSVAICLATAPGFLPSACLRRNFIHPVDQDMRDNPAGSSSSRQRSSPTAFPPSSSPKPAKAARSKIESMRMLSDDCIGEQHEGEQLRVRRQGEVINAAAATTPDSDNTDHRSSSDEALLPATLGSGRYLVQGVLGIGSTASTYRCTTSSTRPSTPSQGRPQGQGEGQRQPHRHVQRAGSAPETMVRVWVMSLPLSLPGLLFVRKVRQSLFLSRTHRQQPRDRFDTKTCGFSRPQAGGEGNAAAGGGGEGGGRGCCEGPDSSGYEDLEAA